MQIHDTRFGPTLRRFIPSSWINWADPGTWGNGEQRLAVAGEIRRACVEAGVQEEPEEPQPETEVDLPQAARELIRELTVEPQGFDEASYKAARSGGLRDEEYVETVGIVARLTAMDIFARGIGVPLRPLPTPRTAHRLVSARQRKKEMA